MVDIQELEQAAARSEAAAEEARAEVMKEMAELEPLTDEIAPVYKEVGLFYQWVYAIEGAGRVKLGIAKHPVKRLAEVQIHSPVLLRLIALAPGNWKTETKLHKRFADRRLHNEWFDITEEEVWEAFAELLADWKERQEHSVDNDFRRLLREENEKVHA